MASVSDNFDRADGEIGANWTEDAGSDIDIVSNKADAITAGTGNYCRMRYTATAMASTDHYSQVVVGYDAGGPESGPTARQASDVHTNYVFMWDALSATFGTILRRHVAGAETDLAYGDGDFTVDKTFKVECNGTTISGYVDGVLEDSLTDSGVTTGNYVGLHGYGTKGLYNDFVGADLAAETDQSAFRFGLDDGSESAHTWDQAENTNTTDTDNQTKLLRVQVEATGDPATAAYTLRYQKNGSGGYVAVPVGAISDVVDSPATDSGTLSGNNTATSSWTTVAVPAYASGSLVIIGIAWDDSTTTTDVTEPAGPNSETILEVNATPETDSSTETRCKVWYYISTDSYAGGNFTFTPSATESWQAVSYAIPSGEFDGTTPIGATNTNNGGTASTDLQHGSFSAGASDGGGRLFCFASADADPQTVASGFTQVGNNDIGAVSGGLYSRDTVVSDSESFSATTFATIAGDSFASVSFVVRPGVASNECYVNTSANIAAGGEDTTARLSVPGGKSFTTGRRWDDENGTDTIDIGDSFYSEFEWAVALSSAPVDTDYFEFRVYSGASALTAYDYTPRWTVGSGGGGGTVTHLIGSSLLNSRLTRSILH